MISDTQLLVHVQVFCTQNRYMDTQMDGQADSSITTKSFHFVGEGGGYKKDYKVMDIGFIGFVKQY